MFKHVSVHFNHISLTLTRDESKEDRGEGSRREEVTTGKEG